MKNPQLKKIASLTGLLLGTFALSAFAATWTAAPCAPPDCNVAAPINVGGTEQTKTGQLNLTSFLTVGDTVLVGYGSSPSVPGGYNLYVNGNSLFSGLRVGGRIITNTLRMEGGDPGDGKILTSDSLGNANWTDPSILQSGNDLRPMSSGIVDRNGSKDIGSDWKLVALQGSNNTSDNGPAGGYVYKTNDGGIHAVLSTGTGVFNDFIVSSTRQCSNNDSAFYTYSLCVKLNGSNLVIETGATISVLYLKIN